MIAPPADHGRVANGMSGVTHQEDTDHQSHDGRDVGYTRGRDRTEVFNDEVVDDVRETRLKQPETNDQTCPGARIGEHRSDPLETGHQQQEHHREPQTPKAMLAGPTAARARSGESKRSMCQNTGWVPVGGASIAPGCAGQIEGLANLTSTLLIGSAAVRTTCTVPLSNVTFTLTKQ